MQEKHPAVLQTYLDLLERLSRIAPTAVTVSDLSGTIIFASPRSAAVHGYTSAESLLGRSAFEFIAPSDRERAGANLKKTLTDGQVEGVRYALTRRDGSIFPGELSASLLRDSGGEPVGFVAFVRDLTPELEAEAALQESQERYAQLVDVVPDPVVVLQDGLYVFVNEAFTRLFGYSQQAVADGLSFFALVQEKDVPAVKARYEARLAGENLPRTFRLELQARDGRVVPIETSATLIQHKGRPADLVVMRDISTQVSAEEERERQQSILAAANRDLEEANRKLTRLHRSKDHLMATVSHELRTPLVTGLGYLDLLMAGHLGSITEVARDRVSVARRNLLRLSTIIDGILDYHSLVNQDPLESRDLRPVDIRALCKETLGDFLVRSDCAPDRVSLEIPEPCPLAVGASDLIRRVLDNLLDNAFRHGGEGVRIRLRVEPDDGQTVRVTVSDNGVGIPRVYHEHLFEPFVRSDRGGEGTGLGLAVVWQLLHRHDTQPRLRSDEGEGTDISFTLLAAPPDATEGGPAPPQPAEVTLAPFSGNVLVVDDDADTREFLDILLRGAGFTPTLAPHAEAAMAVLEVGLPDVILMDMSLPGMDGATLCQRLKQTPRTAAIPVCMFTARAELAARTSASQAACDAYLVKPMAPDLLLGTLRDLIQRGRGTSPPASHR